MSKFNTCPRVGAENHTGGIPLVHYLSQPTCVQAGGIQLKLYTQPYNAFLIGNMLRNTSFQLQLARLALLGLMVNITPDSD